MREQIITTLYNRFNTIKKSVFTIILLTFLCNNVKAQSTKRSDTTKRMLITTIINDSGYIVSEDDVARLMENGTHSIIPLNIRDTSGHIVAKLTKRNHYTIDTTVPFPNFRVRDMNTNELYVSKKLLGKIIVLNFWFIKCGICVQEMPLLNSVVDTFSTNKDVVFIAITYDNYSSVKNFLATQPFNYIVACDEIGIINKIGIQGYPTNIVLNKKGYPVFQRRGYMSHTMINDMRTIIAKCLTE